MFDPIGKKPIFAGTERPESEGKLYRYFINMTSKKFIFEGLAHWIILDRKLKCANPIAIKSDRKKNLSVSSRLFLND